MIRNLATTLICLFLSSCAYRVGYLQKSLPGDYKKIAIPTFKNASGEVGFEPYFTNSLIEEFIRAPFVELSPQEKAEAVLEGQIISVSTEKGAILSSGDDSTLPTGTNLASSYTITIGVQLSLRDVSTQKVVWSSNFSGSKIYQAAQIGGAQLNTANPIYNFSAKQNAVREISKQLMAKAFTRMTESF